jgi:hypothetical protein
MNSSYTGRCACGAVSYEVTAEPAAMADCQCRQCQRDSGTGHQSHMVFVAAEVKTQGAVSHWQCVGDGGTVKQRAFCPTCGSHVYMTFPQNPDVFIVTPASLDDPSRYMPQVVTWTAAGNPWDHIDPALPKFEKMPPV